MTFELLEIDPEIIRALKELGYEKPTTIQKKAIPLIKQGKDVIGKSKTGSGKTAAFGIPILEMVTPNAGLQTLIIAPTRELAVQIAGEIEKFGKYIKCSITTVYGGVSLAPQMKALTKSEIVVGTPGRLLDHLRRKTMDLSKIRCVVLDEADKLVEMGFIEDIRKILDKMPRTRQVLLFGATVGGEIERLKRTYMCNAEVAEAETQVKEEFLQQYYYNIMSHEKFSLLVHLLNKEQVQRAIIFCSAKVTVDLVAKNLKVQGFQCAVIHGNLGQATRLKVMENFNKGKPNILVASAVAARGLDIKDISHIFNYDLSQDPQEYLHRVGRTARAGESGKAITLLCERDHSAFRSIKGKHGMEIKALPKEQFPKINFQARGGYSRSPYRRGPPRRGSFSSGERRGQGGRSSFSSGERRGQGGRGSFSSGERRGEGSSPARRGPNKFGRKPGNKSGSPFRSNKRS
ncbi:MAG: DEAD/DEAH box helicase [Candidatus Woesearchaeota archaeon]